MILKLTRSNNHIFQVCSEMAESSHVLKLNFKQA